MLLPSSSSSFVSTMVARVAVVGGGITGASLASTLAELNPSIQIDVFDQGRSGVGGRTSHRVASEHFRWDHGCQFFRADTPAFQKVVESWIDKKYAAKWEGTFIGEDGVDFFGLPSQPPFYVGVGGIKSIAGNLFRQSASIQLFEGQRVANMERLENKWVLYGTDGEAAFHDSSEKVAQSATHKALGEGYDVVVLTDISSSFQSWHRASAGVPDAFVEQVRTRAGARVPLFTCMVAFEKDLAFETSAAAVEDDTLWFAARSKSKAGLEDLEMDCWTLVSTPEYALQKIKETPMQDPETGEFLPQTPEYLTSVPGPDLETAFRKIVQAGRLGKVDGTLPKTTFLGAQRWGSALPAHRHLDDSSPTRSVIAGVAYDGGRGSLAPTKQVKSDSMSFVCDEDLMLFQAGDVVSTYTPGFEGAVISGIEAANHIQALLVKRLTKAGDISQ